jgi:uncharacterized tellurite resistance protein B-like protein
MLDGVSASDRLLLLKFLCAFAWTDLEVTERERAFVRRILGQAHLGADDVSQVEAWLEVAPAPGSVDPRAVPRAHRKLFLDAVRAMVYADGRVDDEERASLDRLRDALESDG